MELTNKKNIKELLKKYNARPEKYLGQHFILSKSALSKMIEAAEIKKSDVIIEIGPGLGTLTGRLADTNAGIIAIEKDPLMICILKETLANYKNIKIIQSDARQMIDSVIDSKNQSKQPRRYKIVANLPYNAAIFLIRKRLESKNSPELMVLMIQKEVAQRIVARPPHSNFLAMSVQFYTNVEIIDYVKKESFWPEPKVDAAIIKLIPKKNDSLKPIGFRLSFFKVAKAGFSSPRKQLIGNLSKKLNISKERLISIFKNLNISGRARAENLSLKQWQNLASKLK